MKDPSKFVKPIVFVASLTPLALLAAKGFRGELGANPIEVITHSTGLWTLIFLILTLAVTPLRKITGMHWLIQMRRMLGLYAFFYGCLHLTTYLWLDKFFDLHEIVKDIGKRRFITAGMAGFALMIPLALTSTRKMIQRLGGRNWQRLHRLVYFAALAGAIHFYWLVKKDLSEPLLYGSVVAALLLYRIYAAVMRRRRTPTAPSQEVTAA